MDKAKPYEIPKQEVWEAYRRVKANRGAAGVDGESVAAFEKDLKNNLYKIWNRMSSGSYFPPAVRRVEIDKNEGGAKRLLGVPTVADRVAQTVVKRYLEPIAESVFHDDSYGYRPGKSAHDALETARKRCWDKDWVIDLDIRGFFDHLDWDLMMRAVRFHTDNPWVLLYVERWLKVPVQTKDGELVERTAGTPQGGVISPLLANLLLHHALDDWLRRDYPQIQFERYADDVVVHCSSEQEAKQVLEAIGKRLKECGLELHPTKTQIVYCKDDNRPGKYERVTFDFLGYTFGPRHAKTRWGKLFVGFLPAISAKSAKAIRAKMRSWQLVGRRTLQNLKDLARVVDASVRGWMNYYGRFYRSACAHVLGHLNTVLVRWACRKYKRFRGRVGRALQWLERIAKREPSMLVLWKLGIMPSASMVRAV